MSTLGTLVNNVQVNLGDSAASYYTEAEIKGYIGAAFRKVFVIMTRLGQGYFETSDNLGFTSGTETIDLSALSPTFYKISQLERNTSVGTIPLEPSERRKGMNSSYLAGAGYIYQPSYKMRGTNLVLEPAPRTTEAASDTTGLKIDYVYVPTFPTSASADSFEFDDSFSTVFEPLIELDATIAALEAKDATGGVSDIASFRTRYEEFKTFFLDSLERDENPQGIPFVGVDYSTGGF